MFLIIDYTVSTGVSINLGIFIITSFVFVQPPTFPSKCTLIYILKINGSQQLNFPLSKRCFDPKSSVHYFPSRLHQFSSTILLQFVVLFAIPSHFKVFLFGSSSVLGTETLNVGNPPICWQSYILSLICSISSNVCSCTLCHLSLYLLIKSLFPLFATCMSVFCFIISFS